MNQTFFVCGNHFLRQQKSSGDILTHLTRHIVTLYTVHNRILIGILLFHFFIVTFQKTQYLFICRIGFTNKCTSEAIGNVIPGHFVGSVFHQLVFHHVLDLFHIGRTIHTLALIHDYFCNFINLIRSQFFIIRNGIICFGNCCSNLLHIKYFFRSASFNNLQNCSPH